VEEESEGVMDASVINRRKLLQFFGIGTVITPILNGNPIVEAAAKLLAVPEVNPLIVADDFPAGHIGEYWEDRTRWNPYEAIWLRFWQLENNPPSCINYGIGPLEHCLKREPTPAEKAAVAAIIQWFGSNCGHCFVEETLNACGFRVSWDRTLPHTEAVNKLQYGNVWERPGECPQEVTINRRGRNVVLRPGQTPEIL
jgi:hypothetical protein